MPLKNSFATYLCSALLAGGAYAAGAPALDVMPSPAAVHIGEGRIPAAGILVVTVRGASDPRLDAALARAQGRWQSRVAASGGRAPYRLVVDRGDPGPAFPGVSEDESYTLEVGPGEAILHAPNSLGAMHGLETFLQLPRLEREGWALPIVSIEDRPRFPWRGLMIDVARHWQPLEVIERNLDAMAVVKLNVLHLHLTDDQGFRVESLTHPELQAKGSDGNYFTQAQLRIIVAYASARGIRVVPEFDVPGHATSWVVSHPELASQPGPYSIERKWGVFDPVLDPTKEATYDLLSDVFGEMAALFPDAFFHIGGDENNGVQWNASPTIQAFIRDHGLKDNAGLHAYFNTRVRKILSRSGKRVVGWDEILNPELPRDCVIDSWRGPEALAAAASLGFDGILSNGFYIDLCYPASDHYAPDPIPASSTLTPAQRAHILGGEATMWAEWVTPETIDSRIWPRTAAVAERLWSPGSVRDVAEMYRRLAIVSHRLAEAGANHERNAEGMLRHVAGTNLDAPGINSLRILVSLLEPVKHYDRGGLQTWGNQLAPLVGIADAALPESEPSRIFASDVQRLLFSAGGIDKQSAASISARLDLWGRAGNQVAASLADAAPSAKEALPGARALVEAASVGSEAVQALVSAVPLGEAKLALDLSRLDAVATPNASATLLPIIAPVRLLVAAAAKQGSRATLSDAQWQSLVRSTAFPAPAEEAH